jgi:hypothetical protein
MRSATPSTQVRRALIAQVVMPGLVPRLSG